MRQRKVKNESEKLNEYGKYLVQNPESCRTKWGQCFGNEKDIFLEVGCGKGQFVLTLAEQNPDRNYIAIEGNGSVVLRALEKAAEKGIENLLFVHAYINDLGDLFSKGEISGIYLNFSDPWPKERHAKRRLTHERYLDGYRKVLPPDGVIEFKTDNDELFAFALHEFRENGFRMLICEEDLHRTTLAAAAVTTEYEDKFREAGQKIHYCRVSAQEEE